MTWKRLTFILIPHSNKNIKQIVINRTVLYTLAFSLVAATGIMLFYIIGFEGKTFYQKRTHELVLGNEILEKYLTSYDSSLAALSVSITNLEAINTAIMEESKISDMDLKLSGNNEITVSEDGVTMSTQQALAIIDRLDRESETFEYNFSTLFEYCMKNNDFIRHVPSIRPTSGYISKEYGRSFDNLSQTEKTHPGVDFHNVKGTPVVAAADGIVEKIEFSDELGRFILINHQNGYKTRYAHLQTLKEMEENIYLKKGSEVKRGQPIGTIGATGISIPTISAHLMYSVYHHGIPVNPTDYFFASDFALLSQEDNSAAQGSEPLPE